MILQSDMQFRSTVQRGDLLRPPLQDGLTPLFVQRPRIDTRRRSRAFKRAVLMGGPRISPLEKDVLAVPLAGFDPTQPLRRPLPQG